MIDPELESGHMLLGHVGIAKIMTPDGDIAFRIFGPEGLNLAEMVGMSAILDSFTAEKIEEAHEE